MPEQTALASNGGTSLADLLDRIVDRGAVVSGDVIIQLAGIDLIRLDLRLLLVGIETAHELDNGVGGGRDEA
ncbi:gas vesicle protein GvpJ [Actinopolymorpha pittospori]